MVRSDEASHADDGRAASEAHDDPAPGDARQELIDRISDLQRDLGRIWAHDRSLPLLASMLTMQQLKVVMILSFQDSASGQELAKSLDVSLGTVTGIVDRLVARKLVRRREDPEDRRVRRVALTTAGRALADELRNAGLAKFRTVLDQLDVETLRSFHEVMQKIRDVALRQDAEA
ncbi:MAG: MarR family winged helix-turn-helix transcriptional regulator [Micromonosporaceae bacterium]